jgi:hypothetical protein
MTLKYLTEKPEPTAVQLAEADKLDAQAAEARKRAEDSFQRCDTDGFLSQWASSMTSDLNRRKAEILRNGGCSQFPLLVEKATGRVVATRVHTFQNRFAEWKNDHVWRIEDPADVARLGRRWVPRSYLRESRVQKALGLEERTFWMPAYAKVTTGGRKATGLSGCANAFVATFKVGEDDE